MSIKSDLWIRRMADQDKMIEPFEAGQVRHKDGEKLISYGTSSYGYDVRCSNEFKVFIVSGGGIDFLRVFSEQRYGVPPEQVVGTTADAKYELRDGIPTIVKEGNITLIDDKGGKPVGIYRHIGRRPIFAAGNSDGDMAMLQYTTMARNADDKTPTLGLIVHHTDAEREFAYDRKSSMGKLDKALDAAAEQKWLVVDMKGDWLKVFPKK